jgi:sterol desaturase/sphingolipid hydroxylase (fatty acid hydroxylase superfamily)
MFAFLARVQRRRKDADGGKMRQGPLGYFADMVVSPLLAGGLSSFALTHFTNYALLRWLAMVLLGAALWTFIEYTTHRVIYHRVAAFKKYHEAHHADPQAYIGAPPLLGASVVLLISFLPVATFAPALATGLCVGMLTGYTVYLLVHHAIHFRKPTPGTYLYRARLYHAAHHYRNDEGNFGVTTSFWDRVFGTRAQHHPLP